MIQYVDDRNNKKSLEHRVGTQSRAIILSKTLRLNADPTERFIQVRGRHNGVLTFLELETNKSRLLSAGIE